MIKRSAAALCRQPLPLIAGLALLVPFIVICLVPGWFAPYDRAHQAIPLAGRRRRSGRHRRGRA